MNDNSNGLAVQNEKIQSHFTKEMILASLLFYLSTILYFMLSHKPEMQSKSKQK